MMNSSFESGTDSRHPAEVSMMPTPADPSREKNGDTGLRSVADELQRESERLRQLACELKAQEEALAEMRANDPYLKEAVYAALREQFMRELPSLPDKDLEPWAKEEGAQPLESFIHELEPPAESQG
jgi:hypothetical protein